MAEHIIWGVLYSLIVVFGLGLFFYNIGSYKRFVDLTIIGKGISFVFTILSTVMIVSGAKFAFDNFAYSPPPKDNVMAELEEVVITSNLSEKDYAQTISNEEYHSLNIDRLFEQYTDKGKADIRSIAQGSQFTTEIMLRNIGVNLKENDEVAHKLQLLSGKEVDLLDGVDRLLVFADNSAFSASQLQLLNKYASQHSLDYVVIFPTLSGTQVSEFFKNNANEIGTINSLQVVSNDSMPEKDGFSLLNLTQKGYKINNLPAYIFIDKYSIISNAGVGTIFDDLNSLGTFLRRSETDGNKLYLEILESRQLGVKKAEDRLEGVIDEVQEDKNSEESEDDSTQTSIEQTDSTENSTKEATE